MVSVFVSDSAGSGWANCRLVGGIMVNTELPYPMASLVVVIGGDMSSNGVRERMGLF